MVFILLLFIIQYQSSSLLCCYVKLTQYTTGVLWHQTALIPGLSWIPPPLYKVSSDHLNTGILRYPIASSLGLSVAISYYLHARSFCCNIPQPHTTSAELSNIQVKDWESFNRSNRRSFVLPTVATPAHKGQRNLKRVRTDTEVCPPICVERDLLRIFAVIPSPLTHWLCQIELNNH